VADAPTSQYTLQGWAPLTSRTFVAEPVVIELPTWKMNTALGSPCALRVTLPAENSSDEEASYTPGVRLCPLRSALASLVAGRPAASL